MMRSIFGFLISPLFVLFVVWPQAWAQLNSYSRSELAFDNALSGSNPGFESGTVKWTASGGTFAVNSGTQFVPGSKQFASWDSNSASQEVCSSLVKVPESGNCSVGLEYRVPSGTATHKIVAKDGSKDLAIEDVVSSTAAWRHDVEFPCAAAASNQARVCLRSVASNEPAIQFDSGYAGYARTVAQCGVDTPWRSFTPTGSWTTNTTYTGRWRRVGDSAEFQIKVSTIGLPNTAMLTVDLPSGMSIDSTKVPSASLFEALPGYTGRIVAAGGGWGGSYVGYNSATSVIPLSLSGSSSANNYAAVTQAAPATFGAGDSVTMFFKVPIVGWEASQCVTPDAQGWWAAGYISGASVSLGTAAVTTYQEATNGSLTLTPDSGSAPMGITCSSTNAAATPSTGATTCSAGNESLGFSVNVPRAGRYEVCGQFGHNVASSAGDAGINVAFEWVNTATNSQTIVARMGPRTTSGHWNNPASGQSKFGNVTACGQVTLSAGVTAFRLFYEQSIPGTNGPLTNVINIDADPNIGDRAMRVTMRPITGEQQAILANSVSSSVVNGTRIESAAYPGGVSSCGTITQIGDWIQSCTRNNTGNYTVTFKSGIWSSAPQCQLTPGAQSSSSNTMISYLAAPTTSSFQILISNEVGTEADGYFSFTCHGPR